MKRDIPYLPLMILFAVTALVLCLLAMLEVAHGQGGNLLLNGTFDDTAYWNTDAVYTSGVD